MKKAAVKNMAAFFACHYVSTECVSVLQRECLQMEIVKIG